MKLKTKKAAAKRFKITSTGKVVRNVSGRRHLLGHKSSKLKRNKRGFFAVSDSDMNKIKACLPYA
ncbi:50S ribosomal protein L35 [bacterium]|nr:50S ribosomal protein L35 [bacterium]